MADLPEASNPRKAEIDTVGWLFLASLIGLVRHNLRMAIVAGARYWITQSDEAEITFMVAAGLMAPWARAVDELSGR